MNTYMGRFILWVVFGGMICCLASCNNDSVSQEQAESFLKYYAVSEVHNSGTSVIESSDGGYAIMSNIETLSTQNDIILIFTDEFGRQKSGSPMPIETSLNVHGYSMIGLDDGYLISGVSVTAAAREGYLVNVSSDGTVIWEQSYSGYQELEFRDAVLASDGNLIITGYRRINSGDDAEIIMYKVSVTDGVMMWRRDWGWSGNDYIGEALIEFQERYHIISTASDPARPNLTSIMLINTDTDGRGASSEPINTPYLRGKDIAKSPTGHMYILGNQQDPANRISKIFLAELELTNENQVTNIKDSVTLQDPGSNYGASFVPVEGGLAIGGLEEVNQSDRGDILFLKVDDNFNPLTRKTFGSQGYQASQHIIYTLSSQGFEGYALTGSVDLAGARASMLLKLDSEGELR